jgi:hypothetical protein
MKNKVQGGLVASALALASLLISLVVVAMPPSRTGPVWAHHNRGGFVELNHGAVSRESTTIVSAGAKSTPLPDRAEILKEVTTSTDQGRVRVVVDLESAEKAVYFVQGAERHAIPVTISGEAPSGRAAIDQRFIARAAYVDRSDTGLGTPDGLIVDYADGHVEIVRDGVHTYTSRALLPKFLPTITETESSSDARVATR